MLELSTKYLNLIQKWTFLSLSLSSTALDEMCNFYMMYYRNASSDIETPDTCADQYTYESLYDSFPSDSDVALHSSPGHHHHHHHGQLSSVEVENGNEAIDFDSDAKESGASKGTCPHISKHREELKITNFEVL